MDVSVLQGMYVHLTTASSVLQDMNSITSLCLGRTADVLVNSLWPGQNISEPSTLCYDKKGKNIVHGCNDFLNVCLVLISEIMKKFR